MYNRDTDLSEEAKMSHKQVESLCEGQEVPRDQCMWITSKMRVFYQDEREKGKITGKVELTLTNRFTGETWECFNGKYTREADLSQKEQTEEENKIYYMDMDFEDGGAEFVGFGQATDSINALWLFTRNTTALYGDEVGPRFYKSVFYDEMISTYDDSPTRRLIAAELFLDQTVNPFNPIFDLELAFDSTKVNNVGLYEAWRKKMLKKFPLLSESELLKIATLNGDYGIEPNHLREAYSETKNAKHLKYSRQIYAITDNNKNLLKHWQYSDSQLNKVN